MRWVTFRQRRRITGKRSLRRGRSSFENRATAVVVDIAEDSTEQRENHVPRTQTVPEVHETPLFRKTVPLDTVWTVVAEQKNL